MFKFLFIILIAFFYFISTEAPENTIDRKTDQPAQIKLADTPKVEISNETTKNSFIKKMIENNFKTTQENGEIIQLKLDLASKNCGSTSIIITTLNDENAVVYTSSQNSNSQCLNGCKLDYIKAEEIINNIIKTRNILFNCA